MLKPSKRKINKVIIEIGHPNDVHQFKYLYSELLNSGIDVLFLVKKKDIVIELMEAYSLPYKIFAVTPKGFFRKVLSLPLFNLKYFSLAKRFEPDLILSRNSPHSAHYAFLMRIPHFGFADTENSGYADKLAVPFIKYFFTSSSFNNNFPGFHYRYPGYIESWYLHPERFTADEKVLSLLGLKKNEKFSIVRFVSWQAHHDIGLSGLTDEFKIELVNTLSQYGKVFISSEKKLPIELEKYKFSIPAQYMHDALYFATMFYGESATMASECAVLGTPAIYLDPVGRGYTNHQESAFKMVHNFSLDKKSLVLSLKRVNDIFQEDYGQYQVANHKKLLEYLIDPIKFFSWVIINFPQSIDELKSNPQKHLEFK